MIEEQSAGPSSENSWQFDGAASPMTSKDQPNDDSRQISWSASEFIAHEKDFLWFALLGIGTALLMATVFFLTRDYVSTAVVLLVAVLFGVYGMHKPKVRQYGIDEHGIRIDAQQFPYDSFKSFTVIQEGGIRSIELMPLRRFMPFITIYMDPADEEDIIGTLSDYLPFEQREQALVDKLMRRLRF